MRESGDGLSERKKLILKAIVEAHIAAGEPVGSKFLVQNPLLSCSSATIRNEMAELEDLGYLEQPHTSSGRVPSELGYRFYVDSLLQHYAMTENEIKEIQSILKNKMSELEEILEVASRVASKLTNYTGIAVTPKVSSVKVLKYDVIGIDAHNFALVMLLSTGALTTKRIHVDADAEDTTYKALADALNAYLTDRSADDIKLPDIIRVENALGDAAPLAGAAVKAIYAVMSESDGGDVRYTGINQLLQYPEYADVGTFGELLTAFEEKDPILDAIADTEGDGVNILIGSENSVKVMANSAIVYKPIKKDGRTVGAIGVVGPRRMDYAKVLATLEELTGNIDELLDDRKKLNGG